MVRVLLLIGMAVGLAQLADARTTPRPVPPLADRPLPVWMPVCGRLEPGMVVRSARPVKEGSGTERRRFWRGYWQVTKVLDGGRFLAEPLYRRDDTTGEIDRSAFAPAATETARQTGSVLLCEAFLRE